MQFNPGDVTYDDRYPQSTDGFPDPEVSAFECIVMKPGSVLFMPRGTWHRTETLGLSLSVSIILRPPSALESVLDALRARLLQDPAWRKPLHGAWGQGVIRKAVDQRRLGLG
jgi:ribosomal protein L16 Arg81 hydroxylase